MTDQELYERARRAGLAVEWYHATGERRTVSPDTLRAALNALGDFEEPPDEAAPDETCFPVLASAQGGKLASVALQLYSLRGGGFGDLHGLEYFVRHAAQAGLDAVAVSPIHAPFLADCHNVSPYSPSSRLFLNPLYADTSAMPDDGGEFVDWPRVVPVKLAALRAAFAEAGQRAIEADDRLRDHARFEALDAHFRRQGLYDFHNWPLAYRDPRSASVEGFAREHADEIAFHVFLQALTEKSLAAAQAAARDAGMAIGLIADLAIGTSPNGSHAWSAPEELLSGLSIGAPPDIFQPDGQNWGIAGLSPGKGRAAFAETLRRAMRCTGGVRIDHAMGLQRLWMIPDGAGPEEGVYLYYPMQEMLGIVARESRAHRAIVIGEDLGTVDPHFRAAMQARGMLGMEVLWFQRDGRRFLDAAHWSPFGAALTTTHDLPTVAGWWMGRDIDWLERLGRRAEFGDIPSERRARDEDRAHLWSVIGSGPMPPPGAPAPVVEAAFAFVGGTPCPLAMVSVEDVLNLPEQPNMPGTINEHPNWKRRLPVRDIFEPGRVNIAALLRGRAP